MPLKRFFSTRSARRTKSTHGTRGETARNDEHSILSLDETKLRQATSCADVIPGDNPSKPSARPHPNRLVHWSSTGDLMVSQRSFRDILSPATPKRAPTAPDSSRGAANGQKLSRTRNHSTVKKKLSHFEDLSRLEFSPEGYRLTSQQRDLLNVCWRQASDRQGEPGLFMFNWVFTRYPHLKKAYRIDNMETITEDPQFQKHLRAFTEVLELVVTSVVDDSDKSSRSSELSLDDTTGPLLHSYGARHARMEISLTDREEEDWIKPEHWEIFRAAMCEYGSSAWRQNVLTALSSSAQKRNEALHAWRILSYYMIAKVKQGYEMEKSELKKRGRGRSVAE